VTAVFSKKILAEAEALFAKYPDRRAALLPLFWAIQRSEGYLSREHIAAAAEAVGCSPAQALETAEFYTLFLKVPPGRYHLQVCRTLSCDLNGAGVLQRYLQEHLGLRDGETTPDGLFSYQEVECLACCHAGPCLSVNDERHLNMTKQKLEDLIESLRKNG
jgi:NADH-quinone oxidoreductase subunit E